MNSPNDFKKFFLGEILDFLWRKWSAIGVAGGARDEEKWVIDPEALLVFSLDMARYDPRLFDEILDWLVANGKWIDSQRLRGILKNKPETIRRLFSAAALYISKEAKSLKRKWSPFARLTKRESDFKPEILFKTGEGIAHPEPRAEEKNFAKYGFLREKFQLRGMSKPPPVTAPGNLRFLLRPLMGVGSRSECIVYLLTHEGGHPAEIAKKIGISKMAVRNMLIDLADSGLVLTRHKGNRMIEYWLTTWRWGEFIYGPDYSEDKLPIWMDWISLFSALRKIWKVLEEVSATESEYLKSSKLREAMESLRNELANTGLELSSFPAEGIKPEDYEEVFYRFITSLLGSNRG